MKFKKSPQSHLYLVTTSSGFFAVYDAQSCQTTVVGKDEAQAKIELRKLQYPEKEKLPWKKDLADQIDEMLDAKEKPQVSARSPKAEPKESKPKRGYRSAKDSINEPLIREILTGVHCPTGANYVKDGQPYEVGKILGKLTSPRIANRLIREGWAAGIIQGKQRHPQRKKKTAPQ